MVTATSIITAADNVVSWQQGTVSDVKTFLPPDTLNTFVFRRTVNPRGWVHGAFLIGLKDWARATDNDRHWKWLRVRPSAAAWLACAARCVCCACSGRLLLWGTPVATCCDGEVRPRARWCW